MPIITISRTTFSGATAVAEALSEKLNYPCVSKDIIFDAAGEFDVSEQELIEAFEKSPKTWNQTPHKRINLLSYVRHSLFKRVQNHNMVYHGYAGHLLMGELTHVIRVRIIDDMAKRIGWAMDSNQIARKEALAAIEKQDQQNCDWVKFLYGVDWEHPSLYDIVLNLERIDVDGAVEILETMNQLKKFQPTEASKKAFNNELLSSQVWAALTKDPRTAKSYVRIGAQDGLITVTGSLMSDSAIQTIQSVVMKVDGVRQVRFEEGDDPDRLL
jgi:cytidylate kinase